MFKTKVSGIMCYAKPSSTEELYPSFAIYDRRGYEARWLERKMTDEDYFRLVKEAEKEANGR